MAETSLGAAELRFAELIWANAPVSSGALVGLANEAFGWKKSTTYTVLRRLCEKGSLPAFLAAFTRGKTLTREQQDTLQSLIDEARRKL